MKKITVIACLLVLGLAGTGRAGESARATAPARSFKAGGIPILIPPPTTSMSEVGYDNREFMEVFVPSTNRLIAAFVQTEDLPSLTSKSIQLRLSRYAMVQVPRRGEYIECGASDFRELTEGAKKRFGDLMKRSMEEADDEFNHRMKALDLDDATMSLGKPVQLGCLFSRRDAYSFGMVTPLSMGGLKTKMAMSVILMRVRERLLFAYLYAEYENEDTVLWLRDATEDWANSILRAND